MTDFFSRLAERALNIAPTIQPMLAPLYASGPQHIEDGLFDDAEEQEQQNPLVTTILPPKTKIQGAQASTSLQEPPDIPPEISRSSHHNASESPAQPTKLPATADISHRSEIETRSKPQPYPVLQRIVQLPFVPHREQPATTVTQIEHTNNQQAQTISYPATQTPSQHINEQTNNHVQQSEQPLATTEPFTQKNRDSNSLESEHRSNPPDGEISLPAISLNSAVASTKTSHPPTGDISLPTTRSAQAIASTKASHPLPAISRHQKAQEPQHNWTGKEEPAAPIIQVTIGRIEVRATTTSTPNTTTPPRQQGTPPVMSLDDYLNQRAKGGH